MLSIVPNLMELSRLVNNHSASRIPAEDLKSKQLLINIGKESFLIPLIENIINDPSSLKEVASRSYKHVNHFDKIVLVDGLNKATYRLTFHFWLPPFTSEQVEDELIHDHRFCFWSKVIIGRLHSENFEIVKDGKSNYKSYRYFPDTSGNNTINDFYELVEHVSLVKSSDECNRQNDIYYLGGAKIHRVNIDMHRPCCTMVLRGPRINDFAVVYSDVYPTQNLNITNKMFTPEEMEFKLEKILGLLKKKELATI